MKSKTAKICLAALSVMGLAQACDEPDMYGVPYEPFPQDTTARLMYGPPYSDYQQNETTDPAVCPEAEPEAEFEPESDTESEPAHKPEE